MDIILINEKGQTNIGNIIKYPVTYSAASNEYAAKVTLNTPYHILNNMPEIPFYTLENGTYGVLLIKNEKTLFQGIIKSFSASGHNGKNIECVDPMFYVTKNEVPVIQFPKISGSEALKKLFGMFNMPIDVKSDAGVKIDKIYMQKTMSAIINEIIEMIKKETRKSYCLKFDNNTFIFDKTKKQKYLDGEYEPKQFYIKQNGKTFNIFDFMHKTTYSETIENLKNSVVIVYGNEKEVTILDQARNEKSIEKYGLLQKVIKQEKEESGKSGEEKQGKKNNKKEKRKGKKGKK
jgi:phage-like element PBSX protein xkdQ|nr:MAG TPA: 43 kDa tail protein [Caudoviricetes sp.]DAT71567.1 MAG TPA: 43 kDa tail protein [Caudoviricetes sp.]